MELSWPRVRNWGCARLNNKPSSLSVFVYNPSWLKATGLQDYDGEPCIRDVGITLELDVCVMVGLGHGQ